MSDVNLDDALGRIKSSKPKERADGLTDLRHILAYNRHSQHVRKGKDKSFHEILETLFRIVEIERNSYAKIASASSKQVHVVSRLSDIASTIRFTVEVGVQSFRLKTVRALLQHVIDTLPFAREGYCRPLRDDYIKTLRALFEYTPHVEHFLITEWESAVSFVLGILRSFLESDASPSNGGDHHVHNSTQNRRSLDSMKRNSGELVTCIRHLICAARTPIVEQVSIIFSILLECLQANISTTTLSLDAFKTFNAIMHKIRNEKSEIIQNILPQLLSNIKSLWETRSFPLKEQMLVTLAYTLSPASALALMPENSNLRDIIDRLTDKLFTEYTKRAPKDQLQMDDITLRARNKYQTRKPALATSIFHLHHRSVRAENQWAQLTIISQYLTILDRYKLKLRETDREFWVSDVAKKKRHSHHLLDILRYLKGPNNTTKLTAVQLTCFMIQYQEVEEHVLIDIINQLLPYISGDHTPVSAWTMLALTGCAMQPRVKGFLTVSMPWKNIWLLTSRAIKSTVCCRTACYLMCTLVDLDIAVDDGADVTIKHYISQLDTNSPILVSDSSTALLATILLRNTLENPSSFRHDAEVILQWLFKTWKPGRSIDRFHITQTVLHCHVYDIFNIICACTGRTNLQSPEPLFVVLGDVAQAFTIVEEQGELTDYIWISEVPSTNILIEKGFVRTMKQEQKYTILDHLVIYALIAEIKIVGEITKVYTKEKSQPISLEAMNNYFTLYLISLFMRRYFTALDDKNLENLYTLTDDLLNLLTELFLDPVFGNGRVDELLKTLSCSLLPINAYCEFFWSSSTHIGLRSLFKNLLEVLARRGQKGLEVASSSHGTLDIVEEQDLINDFSEDTGNNLSAHRTDALLFATKSSMNISVEAYMKFISTLPKKPNFCDPASNFIDDFFYYLISLSSAKLILCYKFISEVLWMKFMVREETIDEYLGHLGTRLMASYEYERSEAGLLMCLQALKGFLDSWSSTDREDVFETASDIYCWFVSTAMDSGILPTVTQSELCSLLLMTLKVSSDFGKDLSVPSARTALINILNRGSMVTKWFVVQRLPKLFQFYVPGRHEAILQDICDNMNVNINCTEDIALHLLFFCRIGSTWPTLLRLCVYHIFEIAGSMVKSARYATYCIREITHSLQLRSPQQLFRLFSAQLLFTWLETQDLITIPFFIFGYDRLQTLLYDVQDEVVGQLVMRAKDTEISTLARILETHPEKMIEDNIVKATAYSVARDVCSVDEEVASDSSESYLRSIITQDKYRPLVRLYLPQILGMLIKITTQEDKIEKAFHKRPLYEYSSHIMNEIKEMSSSSEQLPANQQPFFNAKYLPDQIERVVRRASLGQKALWTDPSVTIILRTLLNEVSDALGDLHACTVIRKIRIVICFAGEVILRGYPLEILLHSLRPFLTCAQCADDTYGIIYYLLKHSKIYLKSKLSFMAGFLIPACIGLKRFLDFQSDPIKRHVQNTQKFNSWLIRFGQSYCEDISELGTISNTVKRKDNLKYQIETLKEIFYFCQSLKSKGNSISQTSESTLLMKLLDDTHRKMPLFTEVARVSVLSQLTEEFELSQLERIDIISRKTNVYPLLTVLLKLIRQDFKWSRDFHTWLILAVGRLYISCDAEDLSLEYSIKKDQANRYSNIVQHSSHTYILDTLQHCLFGESLKAANYAEQALRWIIVNARTDGELSGLKEILGPDILTSLALSNHTSPKIQEDNAVNSFKSLVNIQEEQGLEDWIREFSITLCQCARDHLIVESLKEMLDDVPAIADKLFPAILHLVLKREALGERTTSEAVSDVFTQCLQSSEIWKAPHKRALIKAQIYLRAQPFPKETSVIDRDKWLHLSYCDVSKASASCEMYSTALLFIELHVDRETKTAGRSPAKLETAALNDMLLQIYTNLNEPDSFYGVHVPPGITSLLDRLDYENDNLRSLLFRGAKLDSQMRHTGKMDMKDSQAILQTFSSLNLNSLSLDLLSHGGYINTAGLKSTALRTARNLEQWNVKAPDITIADDSAIFNVFQGLSCVKDIKTARIHIEDILARILVSYKSSSMLGQSTQHFFKVAAIVSELYDLTCSASTREMNVVWENIRKNDVDLESRPLDFAQLLVSSREMFFSSLRSNEALRISMDIAERDCYSLQVQALLAASNTYRRHGALHNSLACATYLADLIEDCRSNNVIVDAAMKFELGAILWDSNETSASIGILKELDDPLTLRKQTLQVGMPRILSKLGHHIAEARLEKPEEVINLYLKRAIKELAGVLTGEEAAEVFHEFAVFCDKQLQNVDNLEDFHRIQKLKNQKEMEVRALAEMSRNPRSNEEKKLIRNTYDRARQWYEIDEREYQRLLTGRNAFLEQSLENYMLSLQADENHDRNVLRLFSLWLDHFESPLANRAVKQHVNRVPSHKFVLLMNQLSSRLQATKTDFQILLSNLVLRICKDHPYHSMHHIYSGIRTTGGKDETARSRHVAAVQISKFLAKNDTTKKVWLKVYESSNFYHDLVKYRHKDNGGFRSGREYLLEDFSPSRRVLHKVPALDVPPVTMFISIRQNCDYSNLPKIIKWEPKLVIASGISAPKVLTAISSDGTAYKQLFKGGNDDLRQDSIMEQVFEQVSSLLRNHKSTQERKLHIRTYKVLPLSAEAGIIEFVRNTLPLFNYLMPAHEKYHPKDWKQSTCREKIGQAVNMSIETRIKVFKDVMKHYHPVGRYFFLERFTNPDEWFSKRLAYTRSTAAISILGFILGLGDRHCHNILLDEKKGEVVHIDLGVAFEAGRVLPVPELVPFRLTRDLVDAMGITGTEGVFRRCCEFVLGSLREERESIMTVLNVLRYDPLYSWTVSPLKAKRMRETQDDGDALQTGEATKALAGLALDHNESGEANRALAIVEKKLSKTLSTAATVNELIQQATDIKNLALLFHGWAAYA